MAYKQIDERFWKDQKVKKLSKDGYLFFLYLLTSPHTHFTGLSEMTLDYVNIDTPLNEKESKAAFKELVQLGFIDYDKENEIIWIKNMHKYHIRSDKHVRGAEIHINSLPKSKLCLQLSNALSIPYRYPIDTLSETENTLSQAEDTLSIQVKVKVKEEVKEEVKEKEKEEEANEEKMPTSLSCSSEFLKSWELWQQHRKEKKVKLTPTARKLQLKQLESMGADRAIAAINHSITKGYTGIYEAAGKRLPASGGNIENEIERLYGGKA